MKATIEQSNIRIDMDENHKEVSNKEPMVGEEVFQGTDRLNGSKREGSGKQGNGKRGAKGLKVAQGNKGEQEVKGMDKVSSIGHLSGASMDRAVPPRFKWMKIVSGGVACCVIALIAWVVLTNGHERTLRVKQTDLHTAQIFTSRLH